MVVGIAVWSRASPTIVLFRLRFVRDRKPTPYNEIYDSDIVGSDALVALPILHYSFFKYFTSVAVK